MSVLSPELFADRFGDLLGERTFRLELLDSYHAANESEPFRRFLAGEPNDPAWREPWKQFVSLARRRGKHMARVHIVSEPLTDYVRFELDWVYPANVAAGEDVRILPRGLTANLELPNTDYWLFDDHQVGIMTYDDAGNWLHVDLVDDPDVVRQYVRGRDTAMQHAIPLLAYSAQVTMKERHESRAS
jgi:hypothetical protein